MVLSGIVRIGDRGVMDLLLSGIEDGRCLESRTR